MTAQTLLREDLQRHIGYAQSIIAIRTALQDPTPLTIPQRALIETQLSLITGEGDRGLELLPAMESGDDDLVLLGLNDVLQKILIAVYETLVKLIRWAVIAITKVFTRAKGLLMQVRAVRKDFGELTHLELRYPTFKVGGQLAVELQFGSRFALDFAAINTAFAKSKELAELLLSGEYTVALTELGKQLSDALVELPATKDPMRLLSKTNDAVERAITEMGFSTRDGNKSRIELLGNLNMAITVPSVSSRNPVSRSHELQRFDISYEPNKATSAKLIVNTFTKDELNVLLGNIENGLLMIVEFEKKQTAAGLLKVAGDLQTQLAKVMRELDFMRDNPELNDGMIALSRYLTVYAAWVQDPIDHYARYFLNLNASLLQLCRISMRQYV